MEEAGLQDKFPVSDWFNLPYRTGKPEAWERNEDICQCLVFADGGETHPDKRTDRLEREKAVNRCRAMTGIAPRPFRPAPPSIFAVRANGEAKVEL